MVIGKTARQLKNEAKRSAIVDAAIELFGSYGYDEVTVDDICQRAAVSKSSFYLHFKAKDDLLMLHQAYLRNAYIDREFVYNDEVSIGRQLADFCMVNLSYILTQGKELARSVYISHLKLALYAPYQDVYDRGSYVALLTRLIDRGMAEGAFRHRLSREDHFFTLNSWIIGLQIDWAISPDTVPVERYRENVRNTVADMLRTEG
jgi:AcrR family transcriptional regulator